jgi:hypothetical protein
MVVYPNSTNIMIAGFYCEIVKISKLLEHFQSDIHDFRADPVTGQSCKS